VELLLWIAVLGLAFWNGANDNMKGVATLYGSGETSYGGALALATLSTAAGAFASVVLATGLVAAFSGKGLLPAALIGPDLLVAVALGAAATVALASLIGFPISTTHALVGALLGAGFVAAGSELRATALGKAFLVPLALGPVLGLGLAALLERAGARGARSLGIGSSDCICLDVVPSQDAGRPGDALALRAGAAAGLALEYGSTCEARPTPSRTRIAALDVAVATRIVHGASAAAVGFARGLNDTPKMLGILIGGVSLDPMLGALAIAAAMSLGGVLFAQRVTHTLAHRITPIAPARGLAANLSTSLLVVGASQAGLPVSTTHVSTGSILGVGIAGGRANWRTTQEIVAAWACTLPIAAIAGGAAAWLLR